MWRLAAAVKFEAARGGGAANARTARGEATGRSILARDSGQLSGEADADLRQWQPSKASRDDCDATAWQQRGRPGESPATVRQGDGVRSPTSRPTTARKAAQAWGWRARTCQVSGTIGDRRTPVVRGGILGRPADPVNLGFGPRRDQGDAWDARLFGRHAPADRLGRLVKTVGPDQTLGRVPAILRRQSMGRDGLGADANPLGVVDTEVFGALAGVDRRRRTVGPTEGPTVVEHAEDSLGEREVASEGGVVHVVEEMVVDQPVWANAAEDGRTVDQQGAVLSGHGPHHRLELAAEADQEAVGLAGGHVMPAGRLVVSPVLQQASQAEVGSGEVGPVVKQGTVELPRAVGIGDLGGAGVAVPASDRRTLGGRGRIGQERAARGKAPVVGGRNDHQDEGAERAPSATIASRRWPKLARRSVYSSGVTIGQSTSSRFGTGLTGD